MKKEFCRYAVYDEKSSVRLICGEKYKVKQGLHYVENFRGLCTRFKKVSAYRRETVIMGRTCIVVYWFGTFRRSPRRVITETGLFMGLK